FVRSTSTSAAGDVPSAPPAPPAPTTPPTPPAAPALLMAPAHPASPTERALLTEVEPPGDLDLGVVGVRPEAAQSAMQEDAVRLAVLEAVERGEIDVEEALRRLEAADSIPG